MALALLVERLMILDVKIPFSAACNYSAINPSRLNPSSWLLVSYICFGCCRNHIVLASASLVKKFGLVAMILLMPTV